jgi:pimeloyl-[acyl-carrier protein] methyl ester esterase
MVRNLVLLPGMDGTGDLFDGFVAALPPGVSATVGRYPAHDHLGYRQLYASVKELTRDLSEFVLVGESFSSPLAIMFAAEKPPNMAGLIICAGFASNPFPVLAPVLRALAHPWLFRLRPPSILFDRYIFEPSTPAGLKDKVRQNLQTISPEVLAGRAQEILNCDARKELAQIKIPVMYLRGAKDRLIKARCFEEIQKIRQDIQLASIAAPHLVLQHQPQKSVETILNFCSSLG